MTWKLIIFSLVILFVFGSTAEIAFAEMSYSSTSQRLQDTPTYCIVSPTDATTTQKVNLEELATRGISVWSEKLQSFEDDSPSVWIMKSKIISSDGSTAGCDITINFEKKVSQKNSRSDLTILGIFYHASQSIDVSFQDVSLEMVFNVLVHEIGHSIGLGHYVSDDNDENNKWYSGKSVSPSIMIPTTSNDPSKMSITDTDIFKVSSIYGSSGFLPFTPEPLPIPTPEPIPEPLPIPTPEPIPKIVPLPKLVPINPLSPFESIQISDDEVIVSKYDTKFTKITGQIKDSAFHRGNPVYIVVKSSDDFVVHKITPTKSGYFELPLVFDNNSKKGWFEVEASYLEHTDTDINFDFHVGNLLSPSIPKPLEIKPELLPYTTSGKYLENISVSSENNDYIITSYFSEELGAMPSVRITAENECPKKKEVFQKDFLPNPGEKVSFSFYQLDKWNLDECFIHFTISDFNGNVMESIIKNYKIEHKMQQNPITSLQNQGIPQWIKNNAGWWADDAIDDSSFNQWIQFLMKEGLLKQNSIPDEFPSYLKADSKRWADKKISDKEYLLILENWMEYNKKPVESIINTPSSSYIKPFSSDSLDETLLLDKNEVVTKVKQSLEKIGSTLTDEFTYQHVGGIIEYEYFIEETDDNLGGSFHVFTKNGVVASTETHARYLLGSQVAEISVITLLYATEVPLVPLEEWVQYPDSGMIGWLAEVFKNDEKLKTIKIGSKTIGINSDPIVKGFGIGTLVLVIDYDSDIVKQLTPIENIPKPLSTKDKVISGSDSCTELIENSNWVLETNSCVTSSLIINSEESLIVSKNIRLGNSGGTFRNNGIINVIGEINNYGLLENFGTINIFGNISNNKNIINKGIITIENNANIYNFDTGIINNFGAITNNNQLSNFGIINNQCSGEMIGNLVGNNFGLGDESINNISCDDTIVENNYKDTDLSKKTNDNIDYGLVVIVLFIGIPVIIIAIIIWKMKRWRSRRK